MYVTTWLKNAIGHEQIAHRGFTVVRRTNVSLDIPHGPVAMVMGREWELRLQQAIVGTISNEVPMGAAATMAATMLRTELLSMHRGIQFGVKLQAPSPFTVPAMMAKYPSLRGEADIVGDDWVVEVKMSGASGVRTMWLIQAWFYGHVLRKPFVYLFVARPTSLTLYKVNRDVVGAYLLNWSLQIEPYFRVPMASSSTPSAYNHPPWGVLLLGTERLVYDAAKYGIECAVATAKDVTAARDVTMTTKDVMETLSDFAIHTCNPVTPLEKNEPSYGLVRVKVRDVNGVVLAHTQAVGPIWYNLFSCSSEHPRVTNGESKAASTVPSAVPSSTPSAGPSTGPSAGPSDTP
jgi:hypothetical protein